MTELLANVADLEKRLRLPVGSLAGADRDAAETALDDASVLVLAEGQADWTASTVPASARLVAITVALRKYRNPDGFSSESLGGGAYSYRYADDETSAYLTVAEAQIVHQARDGEVLPQGSGFTGALRTPSAYSRPVATGLRPWWDYDEFSER